MKTLILLVTLIATYLITLTESKGYVQLDTLSFDKVYSV
jgi:hypothetical protein